jgi:hypothetical protein
MTIPIAAQAATITACTFDMDTYQQGETGYISVTIFNDKERNIKVTELTATINYYYTDGNIYLQKFFTPEETLPIEIEEGNSSTLHIPLSLPTNIASGYTNVDVKARTQIWVNAIERWIESDHPTYQPTLFIESPYRAQLEEQEIINGQLEYRLEEQLEINKNTTTMMNLLGFAMIVFAAITVFLLVLNRRARVVTQPVTQ